MSPLRWIQFTGSHWTVMLEKVAVIMLIVVGGDDGTGEKRRVFDVL